MMRVNNIGEFGFPDNSPKQTINPSGNDNFIDLPKDRGFRKIIFSDNNNSTSERSYKCPRCGGEFNRWDEESDKDSGPSVTGVSGDKYICPFCGLPRQEYNPEEE